MFETYRNLANYGLVVLDIATVDAPGVIYIAASGVSCRPELFVFGHTGILIFLGEVHRARLVYIHIGVGSDVVCSTTMGNARASIRGTDNKTTHVFVIPGRKLVRPSLTNGIKFNLYFS